MQQIINVTNVGNNNFLQAPVHTIQLIHTNVKAKLNKLG